MNDKYEQSCYNNFDGDEMVKYDHNTNMSYVKGYQIIHDDNHKSIKYWLEVFTFFNLSQRE